MSHWNLHSAKTAALPQLRPAIQVQAARTDHCEADPRQSKTRDNQKLQQRTTIISSCPCIRYHLHQMREIEHSSCAYSCCSMCSLYTCANKVSMMPAMHLLSSLLRFRGLNSMGPRSTLCWTTSDGPASPLGMKMPRDSSEPGGIGLPANTSLHSDIIHNAISSENFDLVYDETLNLLNLFKADTKRGPFG